MHAKDFTMEVFAFGERTKVIETCREHLLRFKCDILDFKMFSDMLVNFLIEIPQDQLTLLAKQLEEMGWNVSLKINKIGTLDDLMQGNLSLTFASGTGERKDIIPSVPG